jgi:hypothetical protein
MYPVDTFSRDAAHRGGEVVGVADPALALGDLPQEPIGKMTGRPSLRV